MDENAVVGHGGRHHGPASDADATTNTITYTLDDDAGGRFAIDANTGVVTVAGGARSRGGRRQPQHHRPSHQQPTARITDQTFTISDQRRG